MVVPDGPALRLLADNDAGVSLRMFPAPGKLISRNKVIRSQRDGLFSLFSPPALSQSPAIATVDLIHAAGPPREIPFGKGSKAVAAAPVTADFAEAAVWRVNLPAGLDRSRDYILRVHYKGDVIRAYLGDQFLTDDFYNGNAFDIGLRRFAPEPSAKDLLLKILPLRQDAPIFLADRARPDFRGQQAVAAIDSVELIDRGETRFAAP